MGVMVRDGNIRIERLEVAPFGTNTYVVTCLRTGKSALVDAPGEPNRIAECLKGTSPAYILMTHNHPDHTGALGRLKEQLKIPVAAHPSDMKLLPVGADILLHDGDELSIGELIFEVIHTPGHTPGSICFLTGKYLISGDTLFPGGPGKTGSPEDFRQIISSLTAKIFVLPDDTRVFPGHGEATVMGDEKEEYRVFSSRTHGSNLCGDVLWLSS